LLKINTFDKPTANATATLDMSRRRRRS